MTSITEADIQGQLARLTELRAAIGQAIVGQSEVVEQLLIGASFQVIGFSVVARRYHQMRGVNPVPMTLHPVALRAIPLVHPMRFLRYRDNLRHRDMNGI